MAEAEILTELENERNKMEMEMVLKDIRAAKDGGNKKRAKELREYFFTKTGRWKPRRDGATVMKLSTNKVQMKRCVLSCEECEDNT